MNAKTQLRATTSVVALLLSATPAFAQTTTAPTDTQAAGAVDGDIPVADPAVTAETPAAQAGTPVAAGEEEAVTGDDIVVTGLRRSLESAQNIKRNSEQFVDAIVAQDIGKLPDITASAALARVTGVQVNRAAGEAAQVQIRGLPDISTTYNGREIFTAETRNVAIQDFPAGAVGALEVFKSSTANLIESGIGGQVNVRSRRPFDFTGFHLSGSANGVHFEQSQDVTWNGNLLISNRWDTGIGEIGILVNAAMTNIQYLDATRENDRFITPDPNVTPGAGDFVRPNGQGVFYSRGDRWRPSVNGAIQWRPTPGLEFYAEGLFQGYRGKDSNHWLFVPTFGASQFSNVVLRDGSNSVESFTVANAANPDGYDEFRDSKTDTYQAAAGFNYTGGSLKVSGDVAYTDSTFTENQANIDYAFRSSPVRNVNFDVRQGRGGGTFDFLNFNAADPANYLWRGLFDRSFRASGDDIQGRIDAQYETGFEFLSRIDLGVRYNDRNATRSNGGRYIPTLDRGIGIAELPVDIRQYPRGFRFDDLQAETQFPAPTFGSVFRNINTLRTLTGFPTGPTPFNPDETFTANEKAYAGYAQVRYGFDIGIPVDGTIGLRAVHTETTLNGTSRQNPGTGGEVTSPIVRTNKYWDYLPNASIRFALTDQLQLRLAYTETRTRPNFDQLNPGGFLGTPPAICSTNVDAQNCFVDYGGGNADLQPLESTNYDVSLEYYFSRTGLLALSGFRRDTSNFIFRDTTTLVIPNAPDVRGNLPVNGGEGRIQGIEAQFTSFLDVDFVPEWARGFGLQANYTYIDGGTELSPTQALQLPGQQLVPFVSKHAYNLVGIYERGPISARLAYNWRSDFVVEYQNLQANFLAPLFQDSIGTLDLSLSVNPTDHITVAFDMLNILAEPVETYRAYNSAGDTYRFQTRYIERVYSLGVRFRF
jgi:TonB-dependent receptor